jgi:hypothetical protein
MHLVLVEHNNRHWQDLATQARQQALGEEAQRYQQSLGTFGTNVAQQQQQLQNLLGTQGQGFGQAAQGFGLNQAQQQQQFANMLGLQQGLFGQGTTLAGLEQALMAQGLDAETARAAAAYASGQHSSCPHTALLLQVAQQQRGQNADFIGGLAGSLFGAAGQAGGFGALFSDVLLKDKLTKVDTLPNGLGLYTWEWNDTAKKLGISLQPTYGVVAQEVQTLVPDAVSLHDNGYMVIDYSHPELQGVH